MTEISSISEIIKNSGGYSVQIICPNCQKESDTEVEEKYRCSAWTTFWFCSHL